jgi:hypothetical protein
MRESTTIRKKPFAAMALLLAVTGIFCPHSSFEISQTARATPLFSFAPQASAQEEASWRRTRYGWLDSHKWSRPIPVPFERRIELVHPLLFAALIALSSTACLLWASEEL